MSLKPQTETHLERSVATSYVLVGLMIQHRKMQPVVTECCNASIQVLLLWCVKQCISSSSSMSPCHATGTHSHSIYTNGKWAECVIRIFISWSTGPLKTRPPQKCLTHGSTTTWSRAPPTSRKTKPKNEIFYVFVLKQRSGHGSTGIWNGSFSSFMPVCLFGRRCTNPLARDVPVLLSDDFFVGL